MLWILILGLGLGLVVEAQGEIHCSGQKLTLVKSCGETVTFPCQFSWAGSRPPSKYELVWQLKKNKKDFVVHDDDGTAPAKLLQNSMFTNRTFIQEGWDKNGNATLQMKDITENDQGDYTCDLLTPKPFDRKICTTITLVILSDSNNCGTDESMNASSGESIQLRCLLKPRCLPRSKREVTWRFTAFNTEREVDLHSTLNAGDQDTKFAFNPNGSLTLQKLSASDSGTYCCYLQGTERCVGVHLRVSDTTVAKTDPDTTSARLWLLLLLLLPAVIATFTMFLVLRRYKDREHCLMKCGCPSALKLCKADQHSTKQVRPSPVVKQMKDDDLDTDETQVSVTSRTGLLPGKSKSGEFQLGTSKESGYASAPFNALPV